MALEKQYNILVVDDAKDTQILLEFDLSEAGCVVINADSGDEALSLLANQTIDLVLLDMYMPGLSGIETLQKIKGSPELATIPVIMLSASDNEDEVVLSLELGAADYVVKPYVAKILLARIGTALRLKEKTEQLEYLARTDYLTGINNRGSFFELGKQAINLCRRMQQPIAVAMFDIDYFKQVNDHHGHDVGDDVLKTFSTMLSAAFRGYDIIGRIGGEEFAICLPNTTKQEAMLACDRLREQVQTYTFITTSHHKKIHITVSIGITIALGEYPNLDEMLTQADGALYFAKKHGRNQVADAQSQEVSSNLPEMKTIAVAYQQHESPMNSQQEQQNSLPSGFVGIDMSVGVGNVLGDHELFLEILTMFYQDHHRDGEKLSQAIESQDLVQAKQIAHTLKGVACSVGAMTLFEFSKGVDLAINNKDMKGILARKEQLMAELNRVMDSIFHELVDK